MSNFRNRVMTPLQSITNYKSGGGTSDFATQDVLLKEDIEKGTFVNIVGEDSHAYKTDIVTKYTNASITAGATKLLSVMLTDTKGVLWAGGNTCKIFNIDENKNITAGVSYGNGVIGSTSVELVKVNSSSFMISTLSSTGNLSCQVGTVTSNTVITFGSIYVQTNSLPSNNDRCHKLLYMEDNKIVVAYDAILRLLTVTGTTIASTTGAGFSSAVYPSTTVAKINSTKIIAGNGTLYALFDYTASTLTRQTEYTTVYGIGSLVGAYGNSAYIITPTTDVGITRLDFDVVTNTLIEDRTIHIPVLTRNDDTVIRLQDYNRFFIDIFGNILVLNSSFIDTNINSTLVIHNILTKKTYSTHLYLSASDTGTTGHALCVNSKGLMVFSGAANCSCYDYILKQGLLTVDGTSGQTKKAIV